MARKRIIILGAGLAGLSAAWHLQKKNIDCLLFEKEDEVGGLCRSKRNLGFVFDYDGHLLHFKERYSFNLVKSLLGSNLVRHKRSAWVYYQGKYIRYPFQANLHSLPSPILKECLLGFIDARKSTLRKRTNFYQWIIQTFGRGIARHFMIPYNKKFWAFPLKDLTCRWLDNFIPVPSLDEVIAGALSNNQKDFGYNAYFWYPKKGGINQLPLALSSEIKNIFTGHKITGIDFVKREIETQAGAREKFDYLVCTIPLPELGHLVRGLPKQLRVYFKQLKWNSVFNLNLGVESKSVHKKHWVYFPQNDISFFRVGFFSNFSSSLAPAGKQSLYTEVSYPQNAVIDKTTSKKRIINDLKKTGILNSASKIYVQDANNIKYAYPVYDKNYDSAINAIRDYLASNNVAPCGRYGSWRYMSMEDSIIDGKLAADSLRA